MNDAQAQLRKLYRDYTGADAVRTDVITGSGSSRSYCRLYDAQGHSLIGVTGRDVEENEAFIYLASHFAEQQLPVPKVVAVADNQQTYLQTDLGTCSLYDALATGRQRGGQYSPDEVRLLGDTMRLLPRVQAEGAEGLDWTRCYPQPVFNDEGMMFDLNYFKYCLLKLSGVEFNEVTLQAEFRQLIADLQAGDDPQGFMYRDFQARNIILSADGQPQLIDFQGGRRGPVYYDVASFLWQASAHYPDTLRRQMVDVYCEAAQRYRQMPDADTFWQRLQRYVFFRMLQVLGAYGFRGLHEHKAHFIKSLHPALRQALRTAQDSNAPYPYLRTLLQQLETTLPPMADAPSVGTHTEDQQPTLTVTIWSFSYKKGLPADSSGNGGGYVFDCRGSHNPGRYEQYKTLTGLDEPVIRFIEHDGEVPRFLENVYRLADAHVQRYIERGFTSLMFAFGCTGGQHRSVYCAQHLAEYLHHKYPIHIHLCHREQGISAEWHPQQ